MPRRNTDTDGLHATSLGLGVGSLLVTAGIAIIALGLFSGTTRYGLAIVAMFAGLLFIGVEIVRLRTRADRGLLLWTALLDAILVAAVVLAITPILAILRGFTDLVGQSKVQSGGDWLAYGFAFTGLFLGALFFAYAVKYYLSTVIVLITTLATGGRNGHNGKNGHNGNNGNGGQHAGLKNGYHIDL